MPKSSQPKSASKPAAINLEAEAEKQRKEAIDELNRPKNFNDLMEYAKMYTSKVFPDNLSISPSDAISPYYGSEYESEVAKAKSYASELSAKDNKRVGISPDFYDRIKDSIPADVTGYGAHYVPSKNTIRLTSVLADALPLIQAAGSHPDIKTSSEFIKKNNYGDKEELAQYFSDPKNLINSFRDTIEHEAMHSMDKYVKFLGSLPEDQRGTFSNWPDVGYMGRNDHLVTGLSKVQREYYAQTGKRFETPEQYKEFIVDLAKSDNQKEKMSGFSEEAKRTLRSQLINTSALLPYFDHLDELEQIKSLKGLEKIKAWWNQKHPYNGGPKGNLYFFEKSAQLIPALVSNNKLKQSVS